VAAAEQLFAERGVDAVSLVEIGRAAAQGNRSAVQYHFGDKAGVLAAIRDKHAPPIERRREAMLDALEAAGPPDLRSLVEVLVRPVADEVRNPDGGAAYVQLNAALIGHPEFALLSRRTRLNPTADRLLRLIAQASPDLPPALLGPRMLLVTGLVFHGIADGARLAGAVGRPAQDGDGPDADHGRAAAAASWERFVRNLVDCTVAVLQAPVSGATAAALG
jgi:AcrR family transcriptional regulator